MTLRQELPHPRVEPAHAPEAPPAGAPPPGAIQLATTVLEHWRRIAAVFVVAAALTYVGRLVFVKQRYEARATLMTVASQRTLTGGLTGAAALSMLTGQIPNAPSPDLVARTLTAPNVLAQVGLSPIDSGGRTTLIQRMLDTDETPELREVQRSLERALDVSIDRKTGLIDLTIRLPDSALARVLVTRDIAIAGRAFADMMRAQASAQREGQEERVKLTAAQLRAVEARQVEFLRGNRVTSPYSLSALEQQSIEREIQIAQQAYLDAVSAREAAYARELEQTPAMVVVDSVPGQLPRVSKFNLFYSLAVALFAAFVYVTLLLIHEQLRGLRDRGDVRALRFLAALRRVPLIGRLAPRE